MAHIHNHEALLAGLLDVQVQFRVFALKQHLASGGLRQRQVGDHRGRDVSGLWCGLIACGCQHGRQNQKRRHKSNGSYG